MAEIVTGMMLGGYRLGHLLQSGDGGRMVFLAQGLADGDRPAVIKLAPLPNLEGTSRLSREFTVLRQVASDGVVKALGYGVTLPHGIDYLILTAHGPSLAVVLAANVEQRLAIESALAMAYAAATAAGQLHLQGWCHGDLKPGNLLCDSRGKVLLSDLEFAFRPADRTDERNLDLQLAGTPPFMAPELWGEGTQAKSAATDVWALGVTLYLALFGEYPFGHGDPESIRVAIERGVPPRLDELPTPLRELLLLLLAPEPSQRLADGKQAAAAIARTTTELGLYLAAGGQSFAQQVASVPHEALAAETVSSTFRPPESAPTAAAPPPPTQPKTEIGLPSPPGTAIGSAPVVTPPPRREVRPEGVGSARGPDIGRIFHSRAYFDISSNMAAVPVRPAAPIKPPSTMTSVATPKPAAAPVPPAASAPTSDRQQLTRRAAARWYRRMNPGRNFPLSVVLSGRQIRIVGGSGLGITLGAKEIVLDAEEPVLNIEPWFPGCLVSPPRIDVHCTQETTVCRFWITPLVCGDLAEACVTIRYRGQVVESLATPSKVVTRTTAKVLATMGLVSPIAGKALDIAGWNPDDILRQSVPYVGDTVARLGLVQTGLLLTTALLVAALGYYYVTRPLLSEEEEPSLLAPANS